ncbi:hypothetical protein KEM52_005034 [Ascosphaera acerosa]|nr:hypothetical protein KEM52_005034 [Ascosphaera acerosa]
MYLERPLTHHLSVTNRIDGESNEHTLPLGRTDFGAQKTSQAIIAQQRIADLAPSGEQAKMAGDEKGAAGGDVEVDEGALHNGATLISTTERKLMMKIDAHVLPPLVVLYLLAFLDRVNISNAAVFKLQQDLDIVEGTKYNTALTIFFVPYIIAELGLTLPNSTMQIPSNILLKKFDPNLWLSICMFGFGLVTLCQGLVQNWSGLMATRFFLGLCESGMFPGCFYLMGSWYSRQEAQKRFSFFFCSTTLAGAFGGLIASGIGHLQGDRGYNGWRWVFIIEGSATACIALLWYFVIPKFPERAAWLKEDERQFIKEKLQKDIGKAGLEERITMRDVVDVAKDPLIWLGSFAYFGLIVPAYGYAYFAPTIIKSYGYSAIQTQLHSIPPWAAAFGFAMVLAYISDRLRHRYFFAMLPLCVCIAGFATLLRVKGEQHRDVQYAALFLVTMGAYSSMPAIVCWFVTNLSGHKRKSIGSAIQIGFGNIGGIISTYSFLSKDAPFYSNGFRIGISFCCLSALACTLYLMLLMRRNRSRDQLAAAAGADSAGTLDGECEGLGDLSPSFRYHY